MSVFNSNQFLPAAIGTALLAFSALPALADDTDIYIDPDVPDTSEPFVMFSLDYRSNLDNTACSRPNLKGAITGAGGVDPDFDGTCNSVDYDSTSCAAGAYLYCNSASQSIVKRRLDTDDDGDVDGDDDNYLDIDYLSTLDIIVGAMKIVLDIRDDVRVGLMMNHRHVNNCEGPDNQTNVGCSNGGYIPFGFESLSDPNNKDELFALLDAIIDQRDTITVAGVEAGQKEQVHTYQGKELFFEFFRYLTGQDIYNGHNGYIDYWRGGNGPGNKIPLDQDCDGDIDSPDKNPDDYNMCSDTPELMWDEGIEREANTEYVSPLSADDSCAGIYTINIGEGVSQQDDDSDSAILASKADGGMDGINLSGANNKFPTVIEWLNDTDLADGSYGPSSGKVPDIDGIQNVTSFFIVDNIDTTTVSWAQAGGTTYPYEYTNDVEKLVEDLGGIFTQILSISTTFVSASVPVNVFNRAQVVDNVYIALFQAEEEPAWPGNLKKLEIAGLESNDPTLVDALGENAIANDGRIHYDALTFWTQTGDDANGDPLLPGNDADDTITEDRDGRHVKKGAAGQKIPGYIAGTGPVGDENSDSDARQLFYDDTSSSLAALDATDAVAADVLNDFGITNFITYNSDVADALDVTTDIVKAQIRWVRGADEDDLDSDSNETEARPWIFGDPLHSKPLPLNYGAITDSSGSYSASNPAIYIAVASNDGYLRLIRNTEGGAGAAQSGEEVWAFMPRSAMNIQPRIRANGADGSHAYGFDGTPVALFEDQDQDGTIEAGDSVTLIIGQRRAGMYYYALDLTDPESPDLLWRIGPSGDFANLGYTFSTPQIGKFRYDGETVYGVVFGGGYDTNKDAHAIGTNDAIGRGVYIVRADTGALIWKAEPGNSSPTDTVFQHPNLDDSVPSDVTIADTDADGYIDRILFGDSGGRVWKADLNGTDRETGWQLVELANLGRHGTPSGTKTDDRRFFHAPDLVQSRDDTGAFDAVIITAGDRADPQDKGGVASNYGFLIKDRSYAVGSATGYAFELGDLHDITNDCLDAANPCTNAELINGWRLQFEESGEKGLSVPLSFDGVVYMTTYLPNTIAQAAICGPAEGSGRLYAIKLEDGSPAFDYSQSEEGKADRYDPLKSGGIPAEVVFLPPGKILSPDLTFRNASGSNRIRTYWQWVEPFDK